MQSCLIYYKFIPKENYNVLAYVYQPVYSLKICLIPWIEFKEESAFERTVKGNKAKLKRVEENSSSTADFSYFP